MGDLRGDVQPVGPDGGIDPVTDTDPAAANGVGQGAQEVGRLIEVRGAGALPRE